jgi:protein SCO1
MINVAVPPSILSLPLTDAQGKPTSLAAYRGTVVVLGDSLTLCQEVCPLLGANFVQMARATARAGTAQEVQFVELTVDPGRDSPARLRAYRELFDPAPANWATLTGPASSIKAIWHFFGIAYSRVPEGSPAAVDWWTGKKLTYDVQHSDVVLFLDARQRERFIIDATPNTSGQSPPKPLTSFLSDEGHKNLTHPEPGASWTVADGLRVVSWLTGKTVQP